MSNLENLIWSEKYRPSTIDECVLPLPTKQMLKEVVASGNIPHLLFSGSPGTGKTTAARAIANELKADMLFINASLEGNMDTLRTKITQFVTSVSFSDSRKIVLLDESDMLNSTVQPALRGFIDMFSNNAIFIFTCNYKSRLIDPLVSRLTVVDFKFSKEEKQSAASAMLRRSCALLDAESVTYDKKAVASVVAKNFPDFRKTLVQLQRYASSGQIDAGIVVVDESSGMDELVTHIKGKDFTKCRQWVANNTLDASTFYRAMYDKLLTVLVPQTIPQIILFINKYQYEATSSVDQEINQISALIEIMTVAQFK